MSAAAPYPSLPLTGSGPYPPPDAPGKPISMPDPMYATLSKAALYHPQSTPQTLQHPPQSHQGPIVSDQSRLPHIDSRSEPPPQVVKSTEIPATVEGGGPVAQEESSSPSSDTTTDKGDTSAASNVDSSMRFINATVESVKQQIMKEELMPKKRRVRTSAEQLEVLQRAFIDDPMPNGNTRAMIAESLGMTPRAVQVWFQNRRAKVKLDTKRGDGTSGGFVMVREGESGDGAHDSDMHISPHPGSGHGTGYGTIPQYDRSENAPASLSGHRDGAMRGVNGHFGIVNGGSGTQTERRASTNSIPYTIDTSRKHSVAPPPSSAGIEPPLSAISEHAPQVHYPGPPSAGAVTNHSEYQDQQLANGGNQSRRGSMVSVASSVSAGHANFGMAAADVHSVGFGGDGGRNRRESTASLAAADVASRRGSIANHGYAGGQSQYPHTFTPPNISRDYSEGPFSPTSTGEFGNVMPETMEGQAFTSRVVDASTANYFAGDIATGVETSTSNVPMEEETILVDANAMLEDCMQELGQDRVLSGAEYGVMGGQEAAQAPQLGHPQPTGGANQPVETGAAVADGRNGRRGSWVPAHPQQALSSAGHPSSSDYPPDGITWAEPTSPLTMDDWAPVSGLHNQHTAVGDQAGWANPPTLTINQANHLCIGSQPLRSPSTLTGHSDSDEDAKSVQSSHVYTEYPSPAPRYPVNRHASLPDVHAPYFYPSPHRRSSAGLVSPQQFPHMLARHKSIDNADCNPDGPMQHHPNYNTPPASPIGRRPPHLPMRSPSASPAAIRAAHNSYFPPQGGSSSKMPYHHPYFPTRVVNRRHSVFEQVPSQRPMHPPTHPGKGDAASIRESAAAFLNRANAQIPKHVAAKVAQQAQAQAQQAQQLAQTKTGQSSQGPVEVASSFVETGMQQMSNSRNQQVAQNMGQHQLHRLAMAHPQSQHYPPHNSVHPSLRGQPYHQMHPHQQTNAIRRQSVDYAMARPPMLARSMSVDFGMARGMEGLRLGSQELGVIVEGEDYAMGGTGQGGEEQALGGISGHLEMGGAMGCGSGYQVTDCGYGHGAAPTMETSENDYTTVADASGYSDQSTMSEGYLPINVDEQYQQQQYDHILRNDAGAAAQQQLHSGPFEYEQPYQMQLPYRPQPDPKSQDNRATFDIPPPVHRGHRRLNDPMRRSMSSPDIWNIPTMDGEGDSAVGAAQTDLSADMNAGVGTGGDVRGDMDVGIGNEFAMDIGMGLEMGIDGSAQGFGSGNVEWAA